MSTTTKRPGTRRRLLWLLLAVGAVAVVALVALAAAFQRSQEARSVVGPGPVPDSVQVTRIPGIAEQDGECAGVAPPATLPRLYAPLAIQQLTMCLGGDAGNVRLGADRADQAATLAAWSDALAQSDERAWGSYACTAVGVAVPPFVIVTAAGEVLRPAVPVDPCHHPRTDISTLIDQLASSAR